MPSAAVVLAPLVLPALAVALAGLRDLRLADFAGAGCGFDRSCSACRWNCWKDSGDTTSQWWLSPLSWLHTVSVCCCGMPQAIARYSFLTNGTLMTPRGMLSGSAALARAKLLAST